VEDADTILVLEDGRIAERGSHEELIEAGGLYADLWAVQAGDIESLPEGFRSRMATDDDYPARPRSAIRLTPARSRPRSGSAGTARTTRASGPRRTRR
jgi:hypothetical protein